MARRASWERFSDALAALEGVLGIFACPKRVQNRMVFYVCGGFRVLHTFAFKNGRCEGSWGRPGGSGQPLSGLLGAPGGVLGRLGRVLGAPWGLLWASCGPLGGLLGPLFGAKKRLGGLLGPIFGAEAFFAARRLKNTVKTKVFEHFSET